MEKESLIASIHHFAAGAHGEQKRKYTPEPYIVHPERVMKICREYTDDICILGAALLHDVLEDTPVTRKEILQFLETQLGKEKAEQTTGLVVELTDVYTHEAYPHLNRGKRKALELKRMASISADAQTVKYADILDNCTEIIRHDLHFARIFLRECEALLQVMSKGDQRIYKRAMATIEENNRLLRENRGRVRS